jgi:hypothetical protein
LMDLEEEEEEEEENVIVISHLVNCAWTPQVLDSPFPSSQKKSYRYQCFSMKITQDALNTIDNVFLCKYLIDCWTLN